MSQECNRKFVNVSSQLEAACFFSVLVTWLYLLLDIIVKSKGDKLHFSALFFVPLELLPKLFGCIFYFTNRRVA